MEKFLRDSPDQKLLWYFAVAAEEGSLRGAAKRLGISELPLSRHIKNLEQSLGLTLFLRHNHGLTLTGSGARVLDIALPLLETQDSMYARLAVFSQKAQREISVGFTTGFERSIFWGAEARLRGLYGKRIRFVRDSSNPLVQSVRRGKLDIALIALPFNTKGLLAAPLPYAEARLLALPESWSAAGKAGLKLEDLRGKPLFMLSRDHNPCFFTFIKSVCSQLNFRAKLLEEPPDHSTTLTRIASGEAMGLFPVSYAALKKKGVVYRPVAESHHLRAQLAIVTQPFNEDLLEEIQNAVLPVLPPSQP